MKEKGFDCFSNKKELSIFLSFGMMLIVLSAQAYAQTLSVSGRVTASRFAVQNASVTFIDNADTTQKFSAPNGRPGQLRNRPNHFSRIEYE